MMKKIAILGCMLLGGIFLCTAQTYNDQDEVTDNEGVVQNIILSPEALANLGIGTAINPKNQTIQGNSVFLTQIGALNTASVNVSAIASEVSLTQNGNENIAVLDYRVDTVVTDITQEGNRNLVVDVVHDLTADVSLDLKQQGNDLSFQKIGTNNLTESLQFIQTEASPSIIIKSSTDGGSPNN